MAEKKEKKERLDVLLVEQGIAESREKAKRYIMAGMVFIGEKRVDKAGEKVPVSSNIIFRGEKLPFVSRGGFKLDKLSLIHISEPTRLVHSSRMPSSA